MEKIFFIIGLSMIFAGGVKASEIIGQISTDPDILANYAGNSSTAPPVNGQPAPTSSPPAVINNGGGFIPTKEKETRALKNKANEDKAVGGDPGEEELEKKAYSSGTLLRNSNGSIYLIEGRVKKYISNLKELQKYKGRPIYDVESEELAGYETREHLDGDLIRRIGNVKVYYIKNAKKIHILNLEELRAHFFGLEIFNIKAEEMALY
jgi:hypothetical protein